MMLRHHAPERCLPLADHNLGCTVQPGDEATLALFADLSKHDMIGTISRSRRPLPGRLQEYLTAVAATSATIHALPAGVNPCPDGLDDRPLLRSGTSNGHDPDFEGTPSAQRQSPTREDTAPGGTLPPKKSSPGSSTTTSTPASPSKTSRRSTPATPCSATTPANSRHSPAGGSPDSASTSPTSPAPQTTAASRLLRNWNGSSPST